MTIRLLDGDGLMPGYPSGPAAGGGGGDPGGGAVIFDTTGRPFTVSKAWDGDAATDWVNDTSDADPTQDGEWIECPQGDGHIRLALNPLKLGLGYLPLSYEITCDVRFDSWGGSNQSWAAIEFWLQRQHYDGSTAADQSGSGGSSTQPGLYTAELLRANDGVQDQLLQKKKEVDEIYGYLHNPGNTSFTLTDGQIYALRATHEVLAGGDVEIYAYIDGVQKLHAIDSGQDLFSPDTGLVEDVGGPYNASRAPYTVGMRGTWMNFAFRHYKVTELV